MMNGFCYTLDTAAISCNDNHTEPGHAATDERGTTGTLVDHPDGQPETNPYRLADARFEQLVQRMRGSASMITDDELRAWGLIFHRFCDDAAPLCGIVCTIVDEITGVGPCDLMDDLFPNGNDYGLVITAFRLDVERETRERGLA
jgi:hypothetical protein